MTTFTTRPRKSGSNMRETEVNRDGQPFGLIWTFRNTRTDRHPWHAKPLRGEHQMFGTEQAARDWMARQ